MPNTIDGVWLGRPKTWVNQRREEEPADHHKVDKGDGPERESGGQYEAYYESGGETAAGSGGHRPGKACPALEPDLSRLRQEGRPYGRAAYAVDEARYQKQRGCVQPEQKGDEADCVGAKAGKQSRARPRSVCEGAGDVLRRELARGEEG